MSFTPLGVTPFEGYRHRMETNGGKGEINIFCFPNGLTYRVMKRPGSLGYESDSFEISVYTFPDMRNRTYLTASPAFYSSFAGTESIGYVSERRVIQFLKSIAAMSEDDVRELIVNALDYELYKIEKSA